MQMETTGTAERFCDHCDEYTLHYFRDQNHERDSSYDYQKCLICEWDMFGMSGRYEPPSYSSLDDLEDKNYYPDTWEDSGFNEK
jgi:hypothetical protein